MNSQHQFESGRSQNTPLAHWLLVSILFLSAGGVRAERGVQAWVQRYSHVTDSDDQARKVVADNAGNVIVAGYTDDRITGRDMLVIKYSGAGVPLWTNHYNGPANGDDLPLGKKALALGPDGSVYVTGSSDGDYTSNTTYDFATIKYISVPVLALERDGNGGFFLQVDGAPNVTYRLQRAPSVNGAWSNLATNTAPASGLIEYHDTSPLPGQAFYRAIQP